MAQSQERRCGDLGRWVFGSSWVVPKAHGYWKSKQTAATTKGVKQSGTYFVGHSRKTKATIEVIAQDEEDSISLDLPQSLGL